MTQENKELLLKDLCGRLPYGVKVLTYKLDYFHNPSSIETLYEINEDGYISTVESDTLRPIGKPYLFPLSSMTEEQKKEYDTIIYSGIELHCERYYDVIDIDYFEDLMDFYHKHHLDYRGLIPMGLAIDATGLNIY